MNNARTETVSLISWTFICSQTSPLHGTASVHPQFKVGVAVTSVIIQTEAFGARTLSRLLTQIKLRSCYTCPFNICLLHLWGWWTGVEGVTTNYQDTWQVGPMWTVTGDHLGCCCHQCQHQRYLQKDRGRITVLLDRQCHPAAHTHIDKDLFILVCLAANVANLHCLVNVCSKLHVIKSWSAWTVGGVQPRLKMLAIYAEIWVQWVLLQ